MDINTYIRSELLKELKAKNAAIDSMIDKGLTRSRDYKRLLSEHRKIRVALRP